MILIRFEAAYRHRETSFLIRIKCPYTNVATLGIIGESTGFDQLFTQHFDVQPQMINLIGKGQGYRRLARLCL